MAILRLKDENGNMIPIPAIKGEAGTIDEVTASVDNTSGEPTVVVTLGGTEHSRTIDLAFSGLKGPEGGTPIVATTVDPGAGAVVDYPDGTVIHVYE